MDLVIRVPVLPRPGETVHGTELHQVPGGKGANQAVAAARAGAEVTLIGRVGNDGFGDAMVASLISSGVDASLIVKDGSAMTGLALIGVDSNGENTIIVAAGANARLDLDDLNRAAGPIEQAAIGVLNFEAPVLIVQATATRLREAGARVLLNLAPYYAPPMGLLDLVDVLVLNETEATALVGPSTNEASLARLLGDTVTHAAVLTTGANGAWVIDGGSVEHIPAYSVEAIDTTGAGDAFVGALAAALAREEPLIDAARYANAAGALACMRVGAQPSLPTDDEISVLQSTYRPE